MNSQNDKNQYSLNTESKNDFIRLEGERTPVDVFEKTIHDDIEDYMFLKHHKRKSQHSRSNEPEDYALDEDFTIVASTKTGRGQKRKKKKYVSDNRNTRYKHQKEQKGIRILKRTLICVTCVLLALVLIFAGTYAYLFFKGANEVKPRDYVITAPQGVSVQDQGQNVYYNGNTYAFNENMTGILCMGIDKNDIEGEGREGTGMNGQADVLILIALDTSTGKTKLINIPRDTMTDVAIFSATGLYVETVEQQICLSYAYGADEEKSADNTVTSVERLFFNFPINSYYALDLEGIAAITDAVGGIDVVSPETIGGFEEGKSYHLEGDQAEAFVRTRDITKLDSNLKRMERQQIFLDSFINTLYQQTKEDIMTPINLFNDAKDYSSTNITPAKVTYLAQNILKSGVESIDKVSVPGEVKMGDKSAEFYVDEEKFYEMFLEIFYTKL